MGRKICRTILVWGLALCLIVLISPYGATRTAKSLTTSLNTLFVFGNQPPSEEWNKTFGGSDEDIGYAVQQTGDGGYIITGYTASYGAGKFDVWLIKMDSKGNEEWNRSFGGSNIDVGTDVQQTDDGGYIITGVTVSEGYDMLLLKTDANGNKVWMKTLKGGAGHDAGLAVRQVDDGGYVVTGYTFTTERSYDVWLVKLDGNGNMEWDKKIGGCCSDAGECIQLTDDGGYIIVGITESYGCGHYDIWLIKVDSEGNEEWNKTFGGSGDDFGFSIQQTSDGGYIIAGCTESYGSGNSDIWLIKTDSNGNEEWNKTFGGRDVERGYAVLETIDGGYIIAGDTESYGSGNSDIWLIKTDSNGNEEWNKTFGGSHYEKIGYHNAIQRTADGGYIIIGCTSSYGAGNYDAWVIKVAPANRPPSTPNTPQGETNVTPLKKYTYTTVSADPDGDEIYYMFDWGDGTTSGWLGPYKSGETVKVSHIWTKSGVYEIKVKAKDSKDAESEWSEPLQITVQSTLLEKIYNMLPEFLRNIILRILDILSS